MKRAPRGPSRRSRAASPTRATAGRPTGRSCPRGARPPPPCPLLAVAATPRRVSGHLDAAWSDERPKGRGALGFMPDSSPKAYPGRPRGQRSTSLRITWTGRSPTAPDPTPTSPLLGDERTRASHAARRGRRVPLSRRIRPDPLESSGDPQAGARGQVGLLRRPGRAGRRKHGRHLVPRDARGAGRDGRPRVGGPAPRGRLRERRAVGGVLRPLALEGRLLRLD
jgi:hypothetical protein